VEKKQEYKEEKLKNHQVEKKEVYLTIHLDPPHLDYESKPYRLPPL